MGTLGEMATAKYLCLLGQWEREVSYKVNFHDIPADVGENIQVRTIDRGHNTLAVRPNDPADAPYVLCLIDPAVKYRVYLLGWQYGHKVRLDGRWREEWPRPAWTVTQQNLNCMTELPE